MEIPKNDLPLHPLSERDMSRTGKRKGSENFLKKNLQKVLVVQKNDLPLHHFPLRKTGGRNRTRNVLYSNIGTAFFEVFEQLNSFSTLFGE